MKKLKALLIKKTWC